MSTSPYINASWNTSASNTTIDQYVLNSFNDTPLSRCSKAGHVMSEEIEWVDGSVKGVCEVCGEYITGRRLPGGFGTRLMKVVMDDYLKGDGVVTREDFAEQVLNLTSSLEVEQEALEEALSILRLAQEMLLRERVALT